MAFSRLCFIFSAVAAFAIPLAGATQVMETTPVPLPSAPDFSSMKFLIGTWSCRTTSSRRPAPYVSTLKYSMSPDGWWIDETTVQKPVPWVPKTLTTYDKITYDSQTRRWVDVSYGDFASYGLATSPGWTGDKMVWHDANFAPTADVTSQSDITTTKNSDTKVTSTSSFSEAGGRRIDVNGTCTKSG